MAYKKSSRDNPDLFGTFLSNVTSDSATNAPVSAQSALDPNVASPDGQASTSDSNSVALLLYLLANGPQPAGSLLSGIGMALEDFFIATRVLKDQNCVESTVDATGETFSLTPTGAAEAERWKSTLSFMTTK